MRIVITDKKDGKVLWKTEFSNFKAIWVWDIDSEGNITIDVEKIKSTEELTEAFNKAGQR